MQSECRICCKVQWLKKQLHGLQPAHAAVQKHSSLLKPICRLEKRGQHEYHEGPICIRLSNASLGKPAPGSQAQFTGLQDLLWSVKTAHHEIRRFLTSRNHRGNTINIMEVQYAFDCRMPHSASQRHIQKAVCYVRNHMCRLEASQGVSEDILSVQASLYYDCRFTQAQFTGLQDLLWSVKTAHHEIRRFLTSRDHRGNTINIMEVQYAFDCRMPHSASQRHIQKAVCYVRNHMSLLEASQGVSEDIFSVQASLYYDCRFTGTVHRFARPAVERKDSTPRNQTLLDKQKPPREHHRDNGGPIYIRLSNASLGKPAPYPTSCMLRLQPHVPAGGLTGCKRRHFVCAGFSLL